MDTLTSLKEKHIQQLQDDLAALEKAPVGEGLAALAGLQMNMTVANQQVTQVADRVHESFIEAINSAEIEEAFTDDERLECYNAFRGECAVIVAGYNTALLSGK